MIKMSKASKMPCKSWSLQAITTCPGSIAPDGGLVDACKGCYATKGRYTIPVVKASRDHNQQDWKRSGWVSDMVNSIGNDPYFRWFDSGDCYHIDLLKKISQVVRQTPRTQHWLPTRQHKFKKFKFGLEFLNTLPNIVVRWSSDSINGDILPDAVNGSTIVPSSIDPDTFKDTDQFTLCRASTRKGKCGDCRACWDKDVRTIAYILQ